MDICQAQKRIDELTWYHEFDFGNGLRSQVVTPDASFHRELWSFIEHHLDAIDFRNKSVLDIGCWDGYWSFYAERRGARSVLGTDDQTQNWSDGRGLFLAKELLGSQIEINQNLSVYELSSLNRKFDIILFVGVYYHLFDPLFALAQIRHCCHPGTLVVTEGSEAVGVPPQAILFDPSDYGGKFRPASPAFEHMIQSSYLSPTLQASLSGTRPPAPPPLPKGRLGWRWRLGMCMQALAGSRSGVHSHAKQIEPPPNLTPGDDRVFRVCVPFEGVNPIHFYKPPFGLHVYDDRFRQAEAAA